MIGKIEAIHISISKGEPRKSIQSAQIDAGKGLLGDSHYGSKAQLIVMSKAARDEINQSDEPGLCFERFLETITIDFIAYEPIVGDMLSIGEVDLRIITVGKRCFPECEILKRGHRCVLTTAALSLEILTSGEISVGDEVILHGRNTNDSGQ